MAPAFWKGFTFHSRCLAPNPVRAAFSSASSVSTDTPGTLALFRLLHPRSAVSTNMLPACAFGKTRPKEQKTLKKGQNIGEFVEKAGSPGEGNAAEALTRSHGHNFALTSSFTAIQFQL